MEPVLNVLAREIDTLKQTKESEAPNAVLNILAREIENLRDAKDEVDKEKNSLVKELSELQENYDSMLAKVNECEQAELRRQKEFDEALDALKAEDMLVNWRRSDVAKLGITMDDEQWEMFKEKFDVLAMQLAFVDEVGRVAKPEPQPTPQHLPVL